MDYYILIIIILVLSFMQSVLGVGLLVLGTPTLLIIGFNFFDALSILLPSSIIISFLQTIESKEDYKNFNIDFLLYCLPSVLVGLLLVIYFENIINFKLFIGVMLIISGIMRFKKNISYLNEKINKFKKGFLLFIGLVHGLTNMGGGLLTLFSSSIFQDKKRIRNSIAYGYLFMGILQYISLLLLVENIFRVDIFLFMLISIISYIFFGKPYFKYISNNFFQQFITYIILIYGFIILSNLLQ